ncbi:hypothetical protein V8E53_005622 [Lactarius tabidus]
MSGLVLLVFFFVFWISWSCFSCPSERKVHPCSPEALRRILGCMFGHCGCAANLSGNKCSSKVNLLRRRALRVIPRQLCHGGKLS